MGEFQRLGAFGQSQRSRCTMLDPAVPSTSHAPHESSRILAAALRVRAYYVHARGTWRPGVCYTGRELL